MQARYRTSQCQSTLQDDDCNECEAKLVRCHYRCKVLARHIQKKGAGGDQEVESMPSYGEIAHFDPKVGVQDHDNHANDRLGKSCGGLLLELQKLSLLRCYDTRIVTRAEIALVEFSFAVV